MRAADSGGTTGVDDPASLRKAGHGAAEIAGHLRQAGAHPEDSTRTAAGALKGDAWYGELGNSMYQALETWNSQVSTLVNKCRSLSEKCIATADNYAKTESANKHIMTSTAAERSPFG